MKRNLHSCKIVYKGVQCPNEWTKSCRMFVMYFISFSEGAKRRRETYRSVELAAVGHNRTLECSMSAKTSSFISKWQWLRFFFHSSGGCSCLTLDALPTVPSLSLLPGRGSVMMRYSVHSIYHNNTTESYSECRHNTSSFVLIHLSEVEPYFIPSIQACVGACNFGERVITNLFMLILLHLQHYYFCTCSVNYPFHLLEQMSNVGS